MGILDNLVGVFGILFALAIILRILIVCLQIKRSPVIVEGVGSLNDRLHWGLTAVIGLEALSITLFRLPYDHPSLNYYALLLPIASLNTFACRAVGLVIAFLGLIVAVVAQTEMGANWRIGNDTHAKTELVRHGLYARSRNPIYVGFIVIGMGLFFALPNAATLAAAILAPLLLSRIVREEEAFQRWRHGAAFEDYAGKVPRWL